MTVLSRGAQARRGGRRPGWLLLTVLLVLAIAASSALVFTNRVELLKLAVILALWAAVVAAFVSVIYRRQSDADQAKVRDLKLVYDLQLDREISARREYELTVETHLRREISSELRSQSADEVAALRAELAALRTNLEILFDADLAHRPAIESDRANERVRGEWVRTPEPVRADRVASSRVTVVRDDDTTRTAESPIIDVPEEPLAPAPAAPPQAPRPAQETNYRGSHRRPSEESGWSPPPPPVSRPTEPRPQPPRSAPPRQPEPPRVPEPPPRPPAPRPQPRPEPARMAPPRAPQPPEPEPRPLRPVEPEWQPMNTWMPGPPPAAADNGHIAEPSAPARPPITEERRGRHYGPPEPAPVDEASSGPPDTEQERRGRHSVPAPAVPAAAEPWQAEPPARHRGSDEDNSPSSGGLSAAELLARLQAPQGGGGRRRRRED